MLKMYGSYSESIYFCFSGPVFTTLKSTEHAGKARKCFLHLEPLTDLLCLLECKLM